MMRTNEEVLEDFREWVSAFDRAEATRMSYYTAAKDLISFLEELQEDVHISNIDEEPSRPVASNYAEFYIRERSDSLADSTLNTRYNYLRVFEDYLTEFYDLSDGTLSSIDIGRYSSTERLSDDVVWFRRQEVEEILQHVPEPRFRNQLLVRTLVGTGVRPVELVNIEIEDIDMENRSIEVIDAKKEVGDEEGQESPTREVPFPESLAAQLKRWINVERESYVTSTDSDYLFITPYSEKMSKNRPNRVVKQAVENAGFQEYEEMAGGKEKARYTAKSCRHTYAMLSLSSGMDLHTLSEILGHSSSRVTSEYYLETDFEMKREACDEHAPDV